MAWHGVCVSVCQEEAQSVFRGLFTSLCCAVAQNVCLCVMFIHKALKIAAKAIIFFSFFHSIHFMLQVFPISREFVCVDCGVRVFHETNNHLIHLPKRDGDILRLFLFYVHIYLYACTFTLQKVYTISMHTKMLTVGLYFVDVVAAATVFPFQNFAMDFSAALLCCNHIHRLHEIYI